MVRLIVRQSATCPDGVCLGNDYRTFDIECAELEKFILDNDNSYVTRTVVGAEISRPAKQEPR